MSDTEGHVNGQPAPSRPSDDGTISKPQHNGSKLVNKQRNHIDYLMRNIEKPIELPTVKKSGVKPPPEIVLNVRGSSAGAGSSDFSIYRDLRRKENLRIKHMDAEAAEETVRNKFEQEADELKRKDEEKTAKNRAKRQKRRKKVKGKDKPASSTEHEGHK
ncbi:PRKR-interacting protein 1 [Coemansia sp. RSA 988]|nr:PRKR-interacting protein 1 [Coemansia sp. RSA 988]